MTISGTRRARILADCDSPADEHAFDGEKGLDRLYKEGSTNPPSELRAIDFGVDPQEDEFY